MNFIDLLRAPWFAVSPSPFSFAFYIIMSWIGSQLLIDSGVKYRRWPRLLAVLDSFFLLGVLVMIQDSMWLVLNTWKWILPLYSGVANFWNYYVRFVQNLLGFLLFMLLSYGNLRLGTASFNRKTLYYFVIIGTLTFAVFALAPSQGWSDWTFAARNSYPDVVVLFGFSLNIIVKILLGLCFLSLFQARKRQDPQIEDDNNRTNFHKSLKGIATNRDTGGLIMQSLENVEYEPCGCLAVLDSKDSRAELWNKVLGCLEFPLKGPVATPGFGPGEPEALFLKGDWMALSTDQKSKIKAAMKEMFGASEAEFEEQMKALGYFPIKDENITVKICGLHTRCML